jgi:uncharacterized protein YciI
MKYYYTRLNGPRPTFPMDMTPAERAIMAEHGAYLRTYSEKGWAVAFGPVMDPKGPFGVAIWEVPDDTDLKAICDADPTIKSGLGFSYDICPMAAAVVRSK